MALDNPPSSHGDRGPSLDSYVTGSFPKRSHNAGSRPIHCAIRGDAIHHKIMKHVRLDELRRQLPCLIHVLRPATKLLEVLVDAAVGN